MAAPYRHVWPRAAAYFGIVFGIGFLLGIVRVLVLEPRVGERWAELAEAPLMLGAVIGAARFVVRRFPDALAGSYLVSGALALLLLLLMELTVVLGVRGSTLSQYFAERDPVAGSVYVVLLLLFAAMPWCLRRVQP